MEYFGNTINRFLPRQFTGMLFYILAPHIWLQHKWSEVKQTSKKPLSYLSLLLVTKYGQAKMKFTPSQKNTIVSRT
jgi:hypothetical protein